MQSSGEQFVSNWDVLNKLHGKIEVEVCEGEENNLETLHENCDKNPGHTNFIPIKEFTMEYLPECYRDTDLFDLVRTLADMTVRLSVSMVSPARPQFWPNSDFPYPFFNQGGLSNMRTGTGKLTVLKFICGDGYNGSRAGTKARTGEKYERDYKVCPCKKCQQPTNIPKKIWWEIFVQTATHVIFDELEAKHTMCRLFYDEKTSPAVIFDDVIVDSIDSERDVTVMKVVTCEDIGDQMYEQYVLCCELWRRVIAKFWKKSEYTLTFIVSHPHGCPKRITIGELKEKYKLKEYDEKYDLIKLLYTTSTCPGSSGARVYCIGSNAEHVHTGSLENRLNYSSFGYFSKE